MRVSQDYAGKTMSAKWLATALEDHNKRNWSPRLRACASTNSTRKSPRSTSCPSSERRWRPWSTRPMRSHLRTISATTLTVGPAARWHCPPLRSGAQSDGHIMQMRGVPTKQQAVSDAPPAPQPTQGNGAGNAYAAASQSSARVQPLAVSALQSSEQTVTQHGLMMRPLLMDSGTGR